MPKKRTCKVRGCRNKFYPVNSFHNSCSLECAIKLTEQQNKAKKAKRRREDKKRLEALQPYSYWVKKCQTAFNKYIRERDKNEPCISCGRHHKGQYHSGHYLTVGSSPGLRFHPWNCHKQCSACNNHLSGNITNYRINLIEKIGLKNAEWLENNRNGYTPTVEELKEIEAYYKEFVRFIAN
jgi:hypothetical protein